MPLLQSTPRVTVTCFFHLSFVVIVATIILLGRVTTIDARFLGYYTAVGLARSMIRRR